MVIQTPKKKEKKYLRLPLHNEGFPVGENMRSIISISHSIDNSVAFLMIPFFLLAYVAWRPLVFSSLLIFSFTLPILHIINIYSQVNHNGLELNYHPHCLQKIQKIEPPPKHLHCLFVTISNHPVFGKTMFILRRTQHNTTQRN